MPSNKVKIRKNSLLARIAAGKMGYTGVAMVIGHTIHLHGTTISEFLRQPKWVRHELQHVAQYERMGIIRFLWVYLAESWKKGYFNNYLEAEARAAEDNLELTTRYDLSEYASFMPRP